MEEIFYSNGKLLLTGEYLVLDGATALAVPTNFGQNLKVRAAEQPGIHWKSYDENGNIWFDDVFDRTNLHGGSPQNPISKTLSKILQEARKLNPEFIADKKGYAVSTYLEFPRNWGLGTSSTLINNIAQWSKTDAFALLRNSFGGSGYDIAAAQRDFPIFYCLKAGRPQIERAHLDWDFTDFLYFVYLNQKQDSKKGIAHYKKTKVNSRDLVRISEIGTALCECDSLETFEKLMEEHEHIIARTVGLETIKNKLFRGYPGTIKSLGAWGGDFVLVTGKQGEMDYFRKKGYGTIISFSEMVKLKT